MRFALFALLLLTSPVIAAEFDFSSEKSPYFSRPEPYQPPKAYAPEPRPPAFGSDYTPPPQQKYDDQYKQYLRPANPPADPKVLPRIYPREYPKS